MKIKIEKPYGLNEKGKRENNEDAFYPEAGKANDDDNLFLVCDGVGGSARGEVASKIVCSKIPVFFQEKEIKVSDKAEIGQAVEFAEGFIDQYLEQNPTAHGMGTTLSLLHLHEKGATIAWCGDSRVYQIRKGHVVLKTVDHSYVNDMLKAGLITPEEAINHPKKNYITRAIQGQSIKKAKADVITTSDIKKGDLFFLCTDGILESFDDDLLLKTLSADDDLAAITERIYQACLEGSNDNFSCYLVKIKEVRGKGTTATKIPLAQQVETPPTGPAAKPEVPASNRKPARPVKKNRPKKLFFFLLTVLIIGSLLGVFLLWFEKSDRGDGTLEAGVNEAKGETLKPQPEMAPEVQLVIPVNEEAENRIAAGQQMEVAESSLAMKEYTDSRDNKSYAAVLIEDTWWFASDLDFETEGALSIRGKSGRFYNREQALNACPDGWRLPSSKLLEKIRNPEALGSLALDYSGHSRNGEFLETDQNAFFWFGDEDHLGKPGFFSLKKGEKSPYLRFGDPETFKPVRCVKSLQTQRSDKDSIN